MKQLKYLSAILMTVALLVSLGCASTATKESTGEYFDDSILTTKVKDAIFREPTLKSAEINVESYKGIVQLSGFVSSQPNIDRAVEVATRVQGVQSVTNNMQKK